MNKQELQLKANEVRKGIVTAVHAAKAGHPGGSLSAADIFTYLFQKIRRNRTETVSYCPRAIPHRDCIPHWHCAAISRSRI